MKINLLLLRVGNTSTGSFKRFASLVQKTCSVEIEDYSDEVLQAFPIATNQNDEVSPCNEEHTIELNYLYSWPTVYAKYYEMFPEWRIHLVIGILDYKDCKEHWEACLHDFWRISTESKICNIFKIFVFNMDELNSPSTTSSPTATASASFLRKDLIFIPCQNEEKINFYIQTLIGDLCTSLKRQLIASLSSLKSKERELLLTPDALNESIGSIEGMTRMIKLSKHRRLKIVGDVCQLLGNKTLAQRYYKICLCECKEHSDAVWVAATQNSMDKSLLESIHRQYLKLRLYFLACDSALQQGKNFLTSHNFPIASKWAAKVVEFASLLSNTDERIFFLLEARSLFEQMKMHRKVSFLSFRLSKLIGESQLNLLYDAIVKGFIGNSGSWSQLKLKIIEQALSICPEDHVVSAKARCYFSSEKLFSFYPTISRHRQEEYFAFLAKMHVPQKQLNELSIFPFFQSISLSSDVYLPRSGSGKAKERIFIYSPIQQEEEKAVPVLVLEEPVNFGLSLYNPLECSVLLKNIKLQGTGFKCTSFDFVILPKSCVNSIITVIPSECGTLSISAVSFNIESWNFLHSLNQGKFVNHSQQHDCISFQVIQPFPLVKVEIPSFDNEIFEGQELRIPFSIESCSHTTSFTVNSITASEAHTEDQLEYEVKDCYILVLHKIPPASSEQHQITLSINYTSPQQPNFFRIATAEFRVKQRKSVRIAHLKCFPMPKEPLSEVTIQTKTSSFHVHSLPQEKLAEEHSLMLCDLENLLIEKAVVTLGDFSLEIPPMKAARVLFPVPKAKSYNLNHKFLLNHLKKTCGMTWNSCGSPEINGQIQWPSAFFDLSQLVPKKFHVRFHHQSFAIEKIFHFPIEVSVHIYDAVKLRMIAPKEIVLEQESFSLSGNSTQTLEVKGASFVRGSFEIRVLILLNDDDANACDDANEWECLHLEIN